MKIRRLGFIALKFFVRIWMSERINERSIQIQHNETSSVKEVDPDKDYKLKKISALMHSAKYSWNRPGSYRRYFCALLGTDVVTASRPEIEPIL